MCYWVKNDWMIAVVVVVVVVCVCVCVCLGGGGRGGGGDLPTNISRWIPTRIEAHMDVFARLPL